MPRICIDDGLYREPKYIKLCLRVGCNYKAMGMLVEAFSLAQKHFLSTVNDRLIPFNEWPEDLNILLEFGFVEKKNTGYRVKGSESQFNWLLQRSNAGKAKKSFTKQANKRPLTTVERNETERNGSELIIRSITRSRSITNSRSISNNSNKEDPTKLEDRGNTTILNSVNAGSQKNLNQEIWSAYQSAYRTRYGVDPTRNATVNAQISQLAKRLGKDAIGVISFFLNHTDGFYISKCHPVGLCLKDAESLRTQWMRGKAITRTDIKRFEQNQERFNLRQAIERGEI